MIYALAISPDGETLASAGADRKIRLWGLESSDQRKFVEQDRVGFIRRLAFSPDGRFLANTSGDRLLKIWELPSRRLRAIAFSPHGRFYAVAFSPDGQTLATSENQPNYDLYLWDVSALH